MEVLCIVNLLVLVLGLFLLTKATIRAWRKAGHNAKAVVGTPQFKSSKNVDFAERLIDVSRTPVGLMTLADWNDPNDPFTVALDLGIDPMTGEMWDEGEPYQDPYFYDGDGL
jgi:hypothetical protein